LDDPALLPSGIVFITIYRIVSISVALAARFNSPITSVYTSHLRTYAHLRASRNGSSKSMRYFCLACDFDGTIAHHGRVAPSTIEALKRVSASGRKLVLVTGRQLDDLLQIFPEVGIFNFVVAENGALLYRPSSQEEQALAEPPLPEFVEELARRGVQPLSVGRCIVATWHPYESTVLDVIRSFGLELQVIFNKDAVMVLPSGVNKQSGLQAALEELGLSHHNVVGVGDAENDHAFLKICECSVAVANALPSLKSRADLVTNGPHGVGVEELINQLLSDDLASLSGRLKRHDIVLGKTSAGEPFSLKSYGTRIIVAGPSGGGKSTTISAIVERLVECQFQVCLIDPEGDYNELNQFVTLGGPNRIPGASEILEVLNAQRNSLIVNLLGVAVADRPSFFLGLLPRIQELRARTGRPHWVIVDEAHHMLPAPLDSAALSIPKELSSFALITVHPDHVAPAILNSINVVIAIGPDPAAVIRQFIAGTGNELPMPVVPGPPSRPGEVIVWYLEDSQTAVSVAVEPAKVELRRHRRKYASGELGEDKSFYFRGPEGKLKLRAQNLNTFVQLALGVDDETWSHHLRNADYSRWLRQSVKDHGIADEVAQIEKNQKLTPSENRSRVIEAIRKHYTAPE
jgi:HAD superfamily hydrolase (TIGR01484 family)